MTVVRNAIIGMGLLGVCAAGCATAARVTLEDRFQAIGIPQDTAVCMVNDLDQELDTNDLTDLAQYTLRISRASSTSAALGELLKIDNPRAVAAIGKAGFSCVTGFGR
ncbi:MAG: hypothetical protein AAF224_09215 [Pseudomonadota bacterium]